MIVDDVLSILDCEKATLWTYSFSCSQALFIFSTETFGIAISGCSLRWNTRSINLEMLFSGTSLGAGRGSNWLVQLTAAELRVYLDRLYFQNIPDSSRFRPVWGCWRMQEGPFGISFESYRYPLLWLEFVYIRLHIVLFIGQRGPGNPYFCLNIR